MLNLRKVSTAFIAAGTINADMLADGAVDLASVKVVGELPAVKLADGAVNVNKLADDAVEAAKIKDGAVGGSKIADGGVDLTTLKVTGELPNAKLGRIDDVEKLKDGLVTLAKCEDDVKATPYVGGEEEQFVIGVADVGIIETALSKVTGTFVANKVRVIASLKVQESGDIGYLKVFVDSEVAPRLTVETSSLVYELVNGEFDVSGLLNGKHMLTVKLSTDSVTGKVYNDLIDFYLIK
jgi:hypothetical protein